MYRIKIQLVALTTLPDKKCPGVLSSNKEELIWPEIDVDDSNIMDKLRTLLNQCFNIDETWFECRIVDVYQKKDKPKHKKDTIHIAYTLLFPGMEEYIKEGFHILPDANQIDNDLLHKAALL